MRLQFNIFPTTELLQSLRSLQQPDQSDIEIPPKEKKFRGYFKIARHYKWALNQVFLKLGYSTAIIVEGTISAAKSL